MTTSLEGSDGSASRPGRSLPPGKTRYPLYRRLGGPQGRSGQVRKISSPTGIRSLDSPVCIQSLYRLRYPAHSILFDGENISFDASLVIYIYIYIKVPLQAWSGPEGSRKLRFPDFMTTAQGGGKVFSHTHGPHLPPGNSPGTHFC